MLPDPQVEPSPHDVHEAFDDDHPLLGSGYHDPRLYVDSWPQGTRTTFGRDRIDTLKPDFQERVSHEEREALGERQISILGRRITVFGDSTAYHSGLHLNIAGRRRILPVDGSDWENLEMRNQRESFARDSILHDRIRAIRARVDSTWGRQ
ncbi:MAG: hypothetical protein GEU90_00485 [Gemmatimonas sp.]|nr:hypothetical protein [Gemmatimonas sp.]